MLTEIECTDEIVLEFAGDLSDPSSSVASPSDPIHARQRKQDLIVIFPVRAQVKLKTCCENVFELRIITPSNRLISSRFILHFQIWARESS
ncbi:hypothetical protein AHF37_08397 [Paragonimus kellicotti]|nr:hypothetical protein AHF37_08397 [Paragonimus kellicotti]